MSKERLEVIKEVFDIQKIQVFADRESIIFNLNDIKWLIEQAERVQELENNIYQDARQIVLEGLYEQNKRYREALEEIINARNHFYPTEYVFGVEGIARKALEESE